MEIQPQLLADCLVLGNWGNDTLLLHRNASLPWFILVPETTAADFLDLASARRAELLERLSSLSRLLKHELGYCKVNLGAIGNVVPQMHLHVVGRQPGDACWPKPVWGNLPEGPTYTDAALDHLKEQLRSHCALDILPSFRTGGPRE